MKNLPNALLLPALALLLTACQSAATARPAPPPPLTVSAAADLVYAFTQYELSRRHPGERWLTLWRGQHDAAEHEVLRRLGPREQVVRLNNLVSFTSDEERAWEFGSTVWEARVALPRIFYASWLLEGVLRGEREALVIGGELRVVRRLA